MTPMRDNIYFLNKIASSNINYPEKQIPLLKKKSHFESLNQSCQFITFYWPPLFMHSI